MGEVEDRISKLSCFSGSVSVEPLSGGLTNRNFLVRHGGECFVVRVGDDNPVHLIVRWHELAAAKAAHRAGIGPEIIHTEAGLLVMRHIAGAALNPNDVADHARLPTIIALIKACHYDVRDLFDGPLMAFWPFHVVRHYARLIREAKGKWASDVDPLLALGVRLENGIGPVSLVFCHNDLLAANIIDDGTRLWLIDYDYAGLNSPLFDLANLASNNGFDEATEIRLLELYLGHAPDVAQLRSYRAMRAASLLRETMWSMVSETHSTLDFDYRSYTVEYRSRLDVAVAAFDAS